MTTANPSTSTNGSESCNTMNVKTLKPNWQGAGEGREWQGKNRRPESLSRPPIASPEFPDTDPCLFKP